MVATNAKPNNEKVAANLTYSWNQHIQYVTRVNYMKAHLAMKVILGAPILAFELFVISFTSNSWSRHNETWKAVGMSIGNLSRKPLDPDLVHFKI